MMNFSVGGYPPGSNLTIMNAIYRPPLKVENSNQRTVDSVLVVYKDNDTGEKKFEVFVEPEYTWYLAKEGIELGPHTHFIDMDKVIPITCKYNELTKSIAENVGMKNLFLENIKNNNAASNRLFFMHPRVFSADLPMNNYIRLKFAETYQNPVIPINKLYFDTEADIINSLTDNISIGECPTNMISLYYTGTDTIYTLVLRNPQNPLIAKLEQDIIQYNSEDEMDSELHNALVEQIGSEEKVEKFGLSNTHLKVLFFDEEQLYQSVEDQLKMFKDNKSYGGKSRNLTMAELQNTQVSIINTKLVAIREMNNIRNKINDLNMKHDQMMKDTGEENSDKSVMESYYALINAPRYGLPTFTQPLHPASINTGVNLSGNIVPTSPIITATAGEMVQNTPTPIQNLSPTQQRMIMEKNPNVKTVVVYNQTTGNKWFDVIDVTTGNSVPNIARPAEFLLDDMVPDFRNGIATNSNANMSFPLVLQGTRAIDEL